MILIKIQLIWLLVVEAEAEGEGVALHPLKSAVKERKRAPPRVLGLDQIVEGVGHPPRGWLLEGAILRS